MFSQACVILFTGGSASVHAGIPQPPRSRHTPPRTRHPHGSRHTPWTRHLPWGVDPPGTRHPLAQSMLGGTVNVRVVRILLECNLVLHVLIRVITVKGRTGLRGPKGNTQEHSSPFTSHVTHMKGTGYYPNKSI